MISILESQGQINDNARGTLGIVFMTQPEYVIAPSAELETPEPD